jgi:uncharacterized membrane protein YphA (DoxX/SURF4 family)
VVLATVFFAGALAAAGFAAAFAAVAGAALAAGFFTAALAVALAGEVVAFFSVVAIPDSFLKLSRVHVYFGVAR